MKKKYLFLISIILIHFCSCKPINKDHKNESVSKNFDVVAFIVNAINNGHVNIDDSILVNLNKQFLGNIEAINIIITDSVIVNNQSLALKVFDVSSTIIGRKDLYTFSICIKNKDSIGYLGNYYKPNELRPLIEEYFDDVDRGAIPVKVRKDTLKKIGLVNVPEIIFELQVDAIANNGLSPNEWNLLLKVLKLIKQEINKIQSKTSEKYFNKPVDKLNVDQLKTLVRIRPSIISIDFNGSCSVLQIPAEKKNNNEILKLIEGAN